MSTLNQVMQLVKTMPLQEQRDLNTMLCANIRRASKLKAIEKSASFELGDVIKFDGKTRGTVYVKVTGFSRDMTKLKGVQTSRGFGKASRGCMWNVHCTSATKVSAEEAARIAAAAV